MHSEDIKLLMKQSSGKDLISFAGGMPNNDLFPVKEIDEIYQNLSSDLKETLFSVRTNHRVSTLGQITPGNIIEKRVACIEKQNFGHYGVLASHQYYHTRICR